MGVTSPSKSPGGAGAGGDEAFKGAGQKVGIEIWRIEKLKCVKKFDKADDKDTPANAGQLAHAGKLCAGDSYIIMQTIKKGSALARNIYMWIGKDSSQDEYGAMAIKAVELDDSLGGEPVQFRETQGHETGAFKALFPALQYLAGGIDTGFKSTADAMKHTNRLLHVKGRRNVSVTQVELKASSLNEGDCFILDMGTTIYQWNGKEASKLEKMKAMDTTRGIRDQERAGKAKVIIVEQDASAKEVQTAFWKDFDPKNGKPSRINKATDDQAHEAMKVAEVKLYEVSDASGKVVMKDVTEHPIKKEHLKTDDAFILYTGQGGIFAWVGKKATKAEKNAAMLNATQFITDNKLPQWTPICRVIEGGETPLFKQNFAEWPEPMSAPGSNPAGGRVSKFKTKVFDPNALHAKKAKEEARLPKEQEGSGSVEVWRIENIKDLAPVDKKEYGQFYAGDSYIILYKYLDPGGKEAAFIYFWQGSESTQDEKAASAMQAKDLDDKMGGYPVQVRVVMNKEPPHFYKIFNHKFVVHAGGIGSGFKNVDQADEYDTDGVRLFHVRGTNEWNTRAIQVAERCASLNSTDAFILETPNQLYTWFGKGCNGDEREFAKRMAPKIHGLQTKNKQPEHIAEGTEPEDFWKALGGKGDYATVGKEDDPDIEVRDPRLFQASNARGYMWCEEIDDYSQEDLISEDCMILDTFAEVFVWIGDSCRPEEKTGAMTLAKQYVETNPERKVEDTTFLVINDSKEPPMFTMHFIGWSDKKRGGKTYEEMVAEMEAANPDAKGMAAVLVQSMDAAQESVKIGAFTCTYEDLKAGCPANVQPTHKEQYLSDEEFEKVFGMDKAKFNGLPKWKQSGQKKTLGLF
jgi:hypothetical protein